MSTPTARNVAPAGSEYAETVRSNHCSRFLVDIWKIPIPLFAKRGMDLLFNFPKGHNGKVTPGGQSLSDFCLAAQYNPGIGNFVLVTYKTRIAGPQSDKIAVL
ncbi:hypothetical protein TNCV_2094911 [Trichonephila clavipes]|nr:hypothetical protein TNCV_2094911 [Trichonephila clavipes]